MLKLKIVNVLCTTRIADYLDLDLLIELHTKKGKNKKMLIYKDKDRSDTSKPCTILIYESGKLVLTGVRSISDASNSIKSLIKKIKKLDKNNKFKIVDIDDVKINVSNIVTYADLNTFIDLNRAYNEIIFDYIEYEPEQFPALICRSINPKSTILLFNNGKMIITGTKSIKVCKETASYMKHELDIVGLL